jgi:hypothetical protein
MFANMVIIADIADIADIFYDMHLVEINLV